MGSLDLPFLDAPRRRHLNGHVTGHENKIISLDITENSGYSAPDDDWRNVKRERHSERHSERRKRQGGEAVREIAQPIRFDPTQSG